jgi:hypothetical protein
MAAYDDDDGFEGVITGDDGGGAGDSLTPAADDDGDDDEGLTTRGEVGGVLPTSPAPDRPAPAMVAKEALGVVGRIVAGSDFHGLVGGAVRLVGVEAAAAAAEAVRGLTLVLASGEGSRRVAFGPTANSPGGGVGRRDERILLSCDEW